jgi:hypothetical protein
LKTGAEGVGCCSCHLACILLTAAIAACIPAAWLDSALSVCPPNLCGLEPPLNAPIQERQGAFGLDDGDDGEKDVVVAGKDDEVLGGEGREGGGPGCLELRREGNGEKWRYVRGEATLARNDRDDVWLTGGCVIWQGRERQGEGSKEDVGVAAWSRDE